MSDSCDGCMIRGCGIFDNNGCNFYEPSPLLSARIHYVKILPEFFKAVIRDDKTFEIRKDDRDYQVDDYVVLREWEHNKGFTKRIWVVSIKYILGRKPSEKAWVKSGDIVFSFDSYSVRHHEKEYLCKQMERLDNGEDTTVS